VVRHGHRDTRIGAFPIGIDFDEFAEDAAAPAIGQRKASLRADLRGKTMILGLDRLDYTKGIPYRLRAIERALRRYPELHKRITLVQVVVPSRIEVEQYQVLKAEIERLVSEINGTFTQPGWVPIHHMFRSLSRDELLAYYRTADVGLITPLKDGMNLVAKEYCACQVDGEGVLVLSEFAGAAETLQRGAILVNPYDLDGVADAIFRAVTMGRRERRLRMRRLRHLVKRQDVHWWVSSFLAASGASPDWLAQPEPAPLATSPARP
jgi:trehalose 6-phosphate synthase